MLWKKIHLIRWNAIARKQLAGEKVALRAKNLSNEQTLKLNLEMAHNVLQDLKIDGHDTVLDLGCSEGFFSREFARLAKSVTGVDSAGNMVDIAIEKAKGIHNLTFQKASIDKLPFDDQTFSAICCLSVLQYLKNYDEVIEAFSEMARVLKKGGKAYVGDVYSDKYSLVKLIKKQTRRNNIIYSWVSFLINMVVFTLSPPLLFFQKDKLAELAEMGGLKVLEVRKTIDIPYADIGTDIICIKA